MAVKKVRVADAHGVAQAANGMWFSLSEEAFSSGAIMFETREEAEKHDARHHAFMVQHYPDAKGRWHFIDRG